MSIENQDNLQPAEPAAMQTAPAEPAGSLTGQPAAENVPQAAYQAEYQQANQPGYQPAYPPANQTYQPYQPYQNVPYYYRLKPATPYNCTSTDGLFALFILAAGFLFMDFIVFRLFALGAGVTVFTGILLLFTLVYFIKNKIKILKSTWFIFGTIVISSAYYLFFSNQFLGLLNLIFLSVCYIYWVCAVTGTRIQKKIGPYAAYDICKSIFLIPFLNLGTIIKSIRSLFSKSKKTKSFAMTVLGFLIALPLIIIVILLLNNADPAFSEMIKNSLKYLTGNFAHYFVDLLFGIPAAFYIFGLIFGCVKKRNTNIISEEDAARKFQKFKIMPKVMAYGALFGFLLIYTLFYISQFQYLFSAFNSVLPSDFSYSGYAKRGFYELCAVAFINLLIILSSKLLVKYMGENGKTPTLIKFINFCLSVYTIGFIAIAVSKMIMYMGAYGLTPLRIYTSWFMVFLFIVFFLIIVRQFNEKFNITRFAACAGTLMFLILCFSNTDALIAKYNVDSYLKGDLPRFNISSLSDLSDSSVPYVEQIILNSKDLYAKNEATSVLINIRDTTIRDDWKSFNFSSARAEAIYEKYLEVY